MNYRALKQRQMRCKRALASLVGLCLAGVIGYQAWADDLWKPLRDPQVTAYSTLSGGLTRFSAQTYGIRAVCSTSCWIAFSVSGNDNALLATSITGIFLPANVPSIFGVAPNGRVAVIRATNDGTISVMELSR